MAEPKRQNLKIIEDDRGVREHGGSGGNPGGVAAVLRAARQRAGVDLREVAETLRIRYPYLLAIEEGRFGDLPGPTYALGFVRAYAEYLDLDGREIVRLFKEEGQGLSRRQALVFPEPLQEGRFPGGTLLAIALVLAAGVYGGWYYWQQQQNHRIAAVSPVPDKIATEAAPAASATPPAATEPAPSEAQASSSGTGGMTSGKAKSDAPVADNAASAPAKSRVSAENAPKPTPAPTAMPAATGIASAPSSPATTTGPAASLDVKPAAPAASTPATTVPTPKPKPPVDATVAATPSNSGTSANSAGSADSTAAAPAPSSETAIPAIPSAPEQVAAVKLTEPRVYGENNADSRITLKAKQDSWVQLRDKDSNVVWTRILRPGDSYKVPNQQGLTLLTGNAGALEVTVDGKIAPALGALGAVRRNIPLDPEKIAAGTATSQ